MKLINHQLNYNQLGNLHVDTITANSINSVNVSTIDSIQIKDSSILLAQGNTTDLNNVGIYMQHSNSKFSGFVKEKNSNSFKLLDLTSLPSNLNSTFTASKYANLSLKDVIANSMKFVNSNNFETTIKSSELLTQPVTLTFPVSVGSNGQLLSSDGNGNLSFVNPPQTDLTNVQSQITNNTNSINTINNTSIPNVQTSINSNVQSINTLNTNVTANTDDIIRLSNRVSTSKVRVGATASQNELGQPSQGNFSTSIGWFSGINSQDHTVCIGTASGKDAGINSVCIGNNAGGSKCNPNSIILNASGNDVPSNYQGLYIAPIRNINSNQNIITYDTSSKELTYDSALYSTIMNNYMTSDNFYLYPPTSAYRVMSLQPSLNTDNVGGFKKNFYLVPFNATITDVVIENVGENNPVKYDIRITKQSGATTTSTTDTITMSSNLSNPSGIANFTSVSYYTNLPTYESYLVHYYPFSYNFVNVADQNNYRSLIGTGGFTQEQIKVGIASYEFTPFNSLATQQLIALNGTGSRNTSGGIFANGYTLIAFWFNVQHNFLANSQNSILFSTQGIGTGTQVQNNNFNIYLKNTSTSFPSSESGFTYQIETTLPYNWTGSSATSETYNSGSRQLTHGTWNHIAVYVTPTRFIVWVNGQTWIYSIERNFHWDNTFLTIGNYPFANQNDWNALTGFMNDLRIYNSTTDYLGDYTSYSTLGTTYPKINNFFSTGNITTSANVVGNSNFISLASPVSVVKGDRIYMELKENTANVSNFDELVSAKLLLKSQ